MFIYQQSTGKLCRDCDYLATGYSGHGVGKNNPAYQQVHDVGPIPQGMWRIASLTIEHTAHGPYVLTLEPAPDTKTFGRSGFLMHGDSILHPGEASLGCIIMPRAIREEVWQSGDTQLSVVA